MGYGMYNPYMMGNMSSYQQSYLNQIQQAYQQQIQNYNFGDDFLQGEENVVGENKCQNDNATTSAATGAEEDPFEKAHQLYMETQRHILSLARQTGFILKGKIDMVGCQYEYQYIYILTKPN